MPRLLPLAAILAAMAAALTPGGPAPGAAKEPAAVIDDFAYADAGAAQAAWQPMAGTAGVQPVRVDGRQALRMPCHFRGTRIQRASWDRAVRLDMSACRGVRFSFLCRDPSPVSHFTLFFQSGDGWYSAGFAPTQKDGWSTITVDKEDTAIEGRPSGWAEVRTIRLSAWRGADTDTEFTIADLAMVGGDADIAILRGESAARRAPSEVESVRQFTRSMARFLKDLGLEYSILNDAEATPARLQGRRLVILPHNPAMPDEAAEAVAAFVEGGGKVLAFYTLPPRLAAACGIEPGGHVREKVPGDFASIRVADAPLAGMPAAVAQQSWNVQDARPIAGRSRVAATWFDKDGKDTGHAAVLVSDKGIYMTHVLLADDAAAKRRMLLAMIGHLVPEAWKQAAAGSLERVGRFGGFSGLDDARTKIAAAAAGQTVPGRDVGQAATRSREAAALFAKGQFVEAIAAAEESNRLLMEAWCLAQKPEPAEHRAFWCHSALGPSGMTWDEAIKVLAENGFTAILPNMVWAGAAYYESRVLPVAPEVKDRGDQVALCLAACKKYGVQCHVWKVNWNMGGRTPKEFAERMKQEGRTQVRFDGRPNDSWLCPSHPENQRLEIDSMVEVAAKYDVDGIHFDYIRYPDRDGCFCPGCRGRFEQVSGAKVARWPADVRSDGGLEARWLDFRRDQITRVVAEVSRKVRKDRPRCRLSAAVFPNWPLDRDGVGQDWKAWCERGYLDFVCPMDYTAHAAEFEGLVARQKGWAGKVPCYPGIGLAVWPSTTDSVQLIDFIRITRRLGTGGFTIFEYQAPQAREVVPLLGKGITRRP